MLEQLKEIVTLIDQATYIVNSSADWQIKFHLVFGLHILPKIEEMGLKLDWYDPDTTYQEDVLTYHQALVEWKGKLGDLV